MTHAPETATEVRVACLQLEPIVGKLEHNRRQSIELLRHTCDAGANLIVLPELTNSGYVFESQEEAEQSAEDFDDSPTLRAWEAVAHEYGVHIVGGIAERAGDLLYNSAVLLGPSGHIGTYRKMHLWNRENLFFTPGDLGFPVFSTPLGHISILICYDGWFPESYRSCALAGADIVCVPTNWVPMAGRTARDPGIALTLVQAAAHTNSIYIAAADRIGVERDQPFIGQSVIADYTGSLIAGPASHDASATVTATIDLARAKRARRWNKFNDPIADRRPSTYTALVSTAR